MRATLTIVPSKKERLKKLLPPTTRHWGEKGGQESEAVSAPLLIIAGLRVLLQAPEALL